MNNPNLEEFFDMLCSDLEILQNKKKKDIVREYGWRREEFAIARSIAETRKHFYMADENLKTIIRAKLNNA